jgi:aspartate carbamoyltransferase catalytic subunit
MSRYSGIKFVLISPKELALPDYVKNEFLSEGDYVECESLEEAIPSLDILYMTRIQGERFADQDEYERLKDSYILDPEKLTRAKPTLSIMHPLPRVNEISVGVDDDPRAHYFDQAEGGRYIRMALIIKLMEGESGIDSRLKGGPNAGLGCRNPHCITRTERGIKKYFVGDRCAYCDQTAKKRS